MFQVARIIKTSNEKGRYVAGVIIEPVQGEGGEFPIISGAG